MPQMTESELKKQIDACQFSSLYFFYGPETYLIQQYTDRLLRKANPPFPDFNLQRFDGREASVDDIADAAEALPFLAERKFVTVSDLDVESRSASDLGKLYELLENLPSSATLLFYCPGVEVDGKKSAKWKKWIAAVNKAGVSVPMERRTGADLEKLLCAAAAKRSCALSRANAALMVRYAGNDLQTLLQELDKLCAFSAGKEITAQAIEQLVTKNLETTVFMLGKAIVAGNYDKAYSVLDLLFSQNEEPVNVLAVLSTVYLDMYRVRAAIQSGFTAQEPAGYFDYKGKEFRLRNAERDGKNLSTAMLRESLSALLETDIALKSARGSRRIQMEKLIARLLLIAQKEKLS